MPYNYTQVSILSAGVAFVLLLIRVLRIGRRPAGYPPGPPTVPLLGNIHQVKLLPIPSPAAKLT